MIVRRCPDRIARCGRRIFPSLALPDDAQWQPHPDDSRRQPDSAGRSARAIEGCEESPQDQARYEQALRRATVDVVEQQVKAGIDIVNDGEFGKSSWSNYVLERLTGFERAAGVELRAGLARPRPHSLPRVHGGRVSARRDTACRPRLRRHRSRIADTSAIRRNIAALKAALAAAGVEEGFLTAVAPGSTGYDSVERVLQGRSRLRLRDR